MSSSAEVIIIGAGLAGLCCALHLHEQGIVSTVLEASKEVGGRIRTDRVAGFLLDRGFQVLLPAYPEARRVLDYDALDLQSFYPGALVRRHGKWIRLADPLRRPVDGLGTLFAGVGTLADKLRVARLTARVRLGSVEDLWYRPQTTTIEALRDAGFSAEMIVAFFRPFLGGIFLERELRTSSRLFEFVFRMFAEGGAALPAGGMQRIPEQIAARLPAGTVRTGARVMEAKPDEVVLDTGERLRARAVVVATEEPAAAALLGDAPPPEGNGTLCLYYAAPEPPISEPILVLNGDGTGPINNLCFPSQVAPAYAPAGRALVSVSVVGHPEDDESLERMVRAQLAAWFGERVREWEHLRSVRIPFALPAQPPGVLEPPHRPVRHPSGVFVCGDHRDSASIQGAMVSGRRAAAAVRDALAR